MLKPSIWRPDEPAMRPIEDASLLPASAAMTASITFAPTGAATAEPPPPCSITVATTYFGSS